MGNVEGNLARNDENRDEDLQQKSKSSLKLVDTSNNKKDKPFSRLRVEIIKDSYFKIEDERKEEIELIVQEIINEFHRLNNKESYFDNYSNFKDDDEYDEHDQNNDEEDRDIEYEKNQELGDEMLELFNEYVFRKKINLNSTEEIGYLIESLLYKARHLYFLGEQSAQYSRRFIEVVVKDVLLGRCANDVLKYDDKIRLKIVANRNDKTDDAFLPGSIVQDILSFNQKDFLEFEEFFSNSTLEAQLLIIRDLDQYTYSGIVTGDIEDSEIKIVSELISLIEKTSYSPIVYITLQQIKKRLCFDPRYKKVLKINSEFVDIPIIDDNKFFISSVLDNPSEFRVSSDATLGYSEDGQTVFYFDSDKTTIDHGPLGQIDRIKDILSRGLDTDPSFDDILAEELLNLSRMFYKDEERLNTDDENLKMIARSITEEYSNIISTNDWFQILKTIKDFYFKNGKRSFENHNEENLLIEIAINHSSKWEEFCNEVKLKMIEKGVEKKEEVRLGFGTSYHELLWQYQTLPDVQAFSREADELLSVLRYLYDEMLIQALNFDLGVNIKELALENQLHFLFYLSGQDNETFKRLRNVLRKNKDSSTKILNTFIGYAGDKEHADNVLKLVEGKPIEIVRPILEKYSSIVDQIHQIPGFKNSGDEQGNAQRKIIQGIISKANLILKKFVSSDATQEEVVKELNNTYENLITLGATYKVYSKYGLKVEDLENVKFENKKSSELISAERDEMLQISKRNWSGYSDFRKDIPEMLKKNFDNPDYNFSILKYEGRIICFFKTKETENGIEISSVNIVPDAKGAMIGGDFLKKEFETLGSKESLELTTDMNLTIAPSYFHRYGFVADSATPDYEGTSEVVIHCLRDKDGKKYQYSGKRFVELAKESDKSIVVFSLDQISPEIKKRLAELKKNGEVISAFDRNPKNPKEVIIAFEAK